MYPGVNIVHMLPEFEARNTQMLPELFSEHHEEMLGYEPRKTSRHE